jgi:membrane protein YdbS with pleckstrin-like domain
MTPRKPHRAAFLFHAIVPPVLLLAVLAIGGGWVGATYVADWIPAVAGGLWIVLAALVCAQGLARYRKEHYEVYPDRIVVRRGGLLSDEELEVHYPNITHVKWIRPWLRHKLFGVGEVYIEVAGSGAGSIVFRDLAKSREAQAEIREHMHQAFSMRTDELLHEEGPAGQGILLDLVLKSGWAVVTLVFALSMELSPFLATLSEVATDQSDSTTWIREHATWLLLVIPVTALGVGLLVLRFLDLKRRTYRVYNGVIEYHEGFLTRNDAIMPVENLSNSEVTRGIAERITNLYHVAVSCQGAGQEVSFLYLSRGPELSAVLDKLIAGAKAPIATAPAVVSAPLDTTISAVDANVPPPLPPLPDRPETTYRMCVARTLIPMGLYLFILPVLVLNAFPILLALLYHLVLQVARIFRTTYTLGRNSIEERFDFITVKQREFSRDKITGVVFRENVFDRMFNTITIQFWSIGAGREVAFRNLKKSDELIAEVRERAAIQFGQPVETIASEFSFGRFICANLPRLFIAVLTAASSIIVGAWVHWTYALLAVPIILLPVIAYARGTFYYPRSKLEIFDDGLVFQRGLLTRHKTYARFKNIKDLTITKIPGHDCGSMRFNVAGESVDTAGTSIPYGFIMRYVPQILGKDELFDYQVLARSDVPAPNQGTGIEERKALGNTCGRTLLISIILFPLIALLPITLPVALWRAHHVRYRIESGRVLMRKGRLYRSQTSILFDRIDHIQTGRGPLNKLFGNGNILISTAGSTRTELVLRDVKGHEAFYQALREKRNVSG